MEERHEHGNEQANCDRGALWWIIRLAPIGAFGLIGHAIATDGTGAQHETESGRHTEPERWISISLVARSV